MSAHWKNFEEKILTGLRWIMQQSSELSQDLRCDQGQNTVAVTDRSLSGNIATYNLFEFLHCKTKYGVYSVGPHEDGTESTWQPQGN